MNPPRCILVLLLVGLATITEAQNIIYSYSVGNWRNGPVVHVSPLVQTTEAVTTSQLKQRLRQDYPVFKDITDVDVLRFATMEEGEESRKVLQSKYLRRGLTVDMMENTESRPVVPQEEAH
ncbi:MAG: hypothetical protein H6594_02395 [Flavobacteriales bacterium]|nr:hypothetical protein [Flavobacteriales bacterium]